MRAPEQPQDSHPKTHAKSIEKAIVLKLFGAPERLEHFWAAPATLS
jgi:hypothetical protein